MKRRRSACLALMILLAGTAAQTTHAAESAPPYEARLLRLSEILGALAHLTDVCGAKDAGQWRLRMQALLEAEGAKNAMEKERLAGAYNRGFRGYALSYRRCTPNAEAIIGRFLTEGGKISDELVARFGAT